MAAKKPDSAERNPRRRMKKIGLRCKFLNRPLHGGGFSMCPVKFLVRSGLNHIVILHCRMKQYYCQSYIVLSLMIRFGIISLLCRITLKSTLRYNHILYTANNIFGIKSILSMCFSITLQSIHCENIFITYYLLH